MSHPGPPPVRVSARSVHHLRPQAHAPAAPALSVIPKSESRSGSICELPSTRAGGSRGVHGTHNVSSDNIFCTPVESASTFSIRAGGLGAAWAVSNVKASTAASLQQPGASACAQKVCACDSEFKKSPMFLSSRSAPAAPVPLTKLVRARGVYNIRRAPEAIVRTLLSQVDCSSAFANFNLAGKNSIQIRNQLRSQLAHELAEGIHDKAFAKMCSMDSRPRADDIEGMVAAFPGLDRVNWDAPDVQSGLDVGLWKSWHARHCTKCTEFEIDDACYFKLVHHFLRTGFEPSIEPGADLYAAQPSCRAYVEKWCEEEDACKKAFDKWVRESENLMSGPTNVEPRILCPLLPVVREKDRWMFTHGGKAYKARLCMDMKNGKLNDLFEEWPFRYLGIQNVASMVQQGDWLATVDISRFYLRLPAGARLRSVQWFQDPASYADCKHNNEKQSRKKMRYRQLLSMAFGLKPAPAYASVVSAELARILTSFGVSVAGVYIDDLLLRAPTKEAMEAALRTCDRVCAALGLDLNDKTVGPCAPSEGIKYLGIIIRTDTCTFSACPVQRAYAVDKLKEILREKTVRLDPLESVAGILTWISYALVTGRPRRNQLYRAIARMKASKLASVQLRGLLQRQLHWWLNKLQGEGELSSYFWCQQPDTPIICSDASGEDGWGACAQGYHFVGTWPESWKQSKGPGVPSMLFKEVLPAVVASLLLARFSKDKVFCCAVDNAGAAFVLNSLTCGCPRTVWLLRALADSLAANHVSLLAGQASRVYNSHTDMLSHALDSETWSQVISSAPKQRPNRDEVHFAVLDIRRGEALLATVSFDRLSNHFAAGADA